MNRVKDILMFSNKIFAFLQNVPDADIRSKQRGFIYTVVKRNTAKFIHNVFLFIRTYRLTIIFLFVACCIEPVLCFSIKGLHSDDYHNVLRLVFFSLFSASIYCMTLIPCALLNSFFSRIYSLLLCIVLFAYIISCCFLAFNEIAIWSEAYYQVVRETDLREVFLFCTYHTCYLYIILLCLSLLFLLFFLERKKMAIKLEYKHKFYLTILLCIPYMIFKIGAKTYIGCDICLWFRPRAVQSFVRYLYTNDDSISEILRLNREGKNPKNLHHDPYHTLGIVVIGESCTRSHMQCYGYKKRETTPETMKHLHDWVLYTDVVAASIVTSISVEYILTDKNCFCKNTPNYSIPAIFDEMPDCKLSFVTNQKKSIGGSGSIELLFKCNRDTSWTEQLYGKIIPDAELLPILQTKINDLKKYTKGLFVLQLSGSHFPYKLTSSPQKNTWENFTESDRYDHSLRYTDGVIESIRRIVEGVQYPAWILYLSDHGESPDNGMRNTSDYRTWEIPFMFYFNKSFRENNKFLIDQIIRCRNIPFQSDCTYEIILDLMGISYSGFIRERIPYFQSYHPVKRDLRNLPDKSWKNQ